VKTPKIEYGFYDGFPTRFSSPPSLEIWCLSDDGAWFEPSCPLHVYCYECAVLTEAEFHRLFGHALPPLPDAAFRSGWRSSLV
jgi:hypothetical protein